MKPVKLLLFEALEDRALLSQPSPTISKPLPVSAASLLHLRKPPSRPQGRVASALPGAPAFGTVPARPVIISVSSRGQTRALTVTWKPVTGATTYQLERSSDGAAWATVQTTAGTSATDAGLSESSSYRYRLRALNSDGMSNPSVVVTGKTESFKVFDGTLFNNRPTDLGQGILPIYVSYGGPLNALSEPDEAATRALARQVADQGQMLVLDIESWASDIRQAPEIEVRRTVSRFLQIIDWARAERPVLKIGVYGNWPRTPFTIPQNAAQDTALKQANDYLIARMAPSVDFILPSFYLSSTDLGDWQTWTKTTMADARRFGKPVYPFIWMDFDTNPTSALPVNFWEFIMGTVRSEADGMVIWGGGGQTWDPNAPWWTATQAFLTQFPAIPAAPSAVQINPTGAILSWLDNSNNESGFQIERSTDGVNFSVVGASGANDSTWHDSRIVSGQLYYYRVSALSAWGSSALSNVVSATVARNALVLNQAEGFEQSSGVIATPNSAVGLDAGDWILYKNVDFGSGANQVDLRIGVPASNAGQRIEFHLDSVNGPLIDTHTIIATSDFGDFSMQSSTIAATSGIHDLYLVFQTRLSDGLGSGAGSFDWFMFASNAAPAAPTKLVVNSAGTHISLAWSDNSGDENGFLIERSINGIDFTPLASVGANVTAFDDSGLSLGLKYTYRVRAIGAYGNSDPSNTDQGVRGTRDALDLIQAEDYDVQNGISVINSSSVGFIDDGDSLGYFGVDFGQGVNQVLVRAGLPYENDGGQMEMRIDSLDGPVIGTVALHPTGGFFKLNMQIGAVTPISGIHDVYLTFKGGYGIANIDWVTFSGIG